MKKTLLVAAMASVILTGCWTGAEVKEMADETKAAAVEAVEQAKATTVEVAEEAKVVALEVKEQVVTKAEAAKAELDALIADPADQKACGLAAMKLGYYNGSPSEIKFMKPGTYEIAEFIEAGKSHYVPATCTVNGGEASLSYEYPAPVVAPMGEVGEEVQPELSPSDKMKEAFTIKAVEPEAPAVPVVSDEQQLEDRVLCANVAKSLGYYTEGGDYNEGSEYEMVGDGVYVVERLTEKPGTPMSVATCEIDADGGVTFHIGKA